MHEPRRAAPLPPPTPTPGAAERRGRRQAAGGPQPLPAAPPAPLRPPCGERGPRPGPARPSPGGHRGRPLHLAAAPPAARGARCQGERRRARAARAGQEVRGAEEVWRAPGQPPPRPAAAGTARPGPPRAPGGQRPAAGSARRQTAARRRRRLRPPARPPPLLAPALQPTSKFPVPTAGAGVAGKRRVGKRGRREPQAGEIKVRTADLIFDSRADAAGIFLVQIFQNSDNSNKKVRQCVSSINSAGRFPLPTSACYLSQVEDKGPCESRV